MIISFSVKNFGSIKSEQTLSFEADNSSHLAEHYIIKGPSELKLLKLALIYGANASGKTTVLTALDFLRDLAIKPLTKKTDELDFDPFLFDSRTAAENSSMSISFIQENIKYFYKLEFSRKAIISEELYFFNPNKAKVFKRTTDLDSQFSKISFGSKIKTDKTFEKTLESNTLWNNTVLGGYLKTNIELPALKQVVDWFGLYLKPIVDTQTNLENFVVSGMESLSISKEHVIKILKQADFNISNIDFEEKEQWSDEVERAFRALAVSEERIERIKQNPPRKVTFEHTVKGSKYSLPFELESDGTKRYFGFAGLLSLLITTSAAIPIDELEMSLHPDLYLHFILTFIMNSKGSQLIATTHNREILGNKDIFRNDVIWFADKPENGATELYSLADFDSSVIRDSTNVLNAYKSGKLRAAPNLGDYYIDIQ